MARRLLSECAKHVVLFGVIAAPLTGATWQQCPGPYVGQVLCLSFHGTDLLAGTYGGGMLRRRQSSWQRVESLPATIVSDISCTGSDTAFAATWDEGLFRSVDGGVSWSSVCRAPEYTATGDETRGVAVLGSVVLVATRLGGLLCSRDRGQSWQNLLLDTTMPAELASVSCFLRMGTGSFVGGNRGICRSDDDGATWQYCSPRLGDGSVSGRVDCMAESQGVIWAGTYQAGVWLSLDSGATWSPCTTALPYLGSEWGYSSVSAILPIAEDLLFCATGRGVFVSSNGGTSWADGGLVSEGPYVRTTSLVSSGSAVWCGANDGVYVLTDSTTWDAANDGMLAGFMTHVYACTLGVFATDYYRGVYRAALPLCGQWERILAANRPRSPFYAAGRVYVGDAEGVQVSDDGGSSWQRMDLGIENASQDCITSFVSDGQRVYASGEGGIHRLSTGDSTWTRIGLPNSTMFGLRCHQGSLYGLERGVWVSHNHGDTWSLLLDQPVENLAIMDRELYVTKSLSPDIGTVCRSPDLGQTWQCSLSVLPQPLSMVVVGDALIAATVAGTYVSRDSARTWSLYAEPLTTPWISDLFLGGSAVFAATGGSSVQTLDVSDLLAVRPTVAAAGPGLLWSSDPHLVNLMGRAIARCATNSRGTTRVHASGMYVSHQQELERVDIKPFFSLR